MRDLRVYVEHYGAFAHDATFYSRRGDGPYYRWLYAETPGLWRFSRVHLSKLTLRVLSIADWDAVPAALQDRLGEHYLE